MKKLSILVLSLFVAGCAAGRNVQPDVDAKVESLQNQLQAKNKEVGALMDQVRALQSQADICSQDKRDCERRLDEALGKLSSRSGGKASVSDYAK